MDLSKLTYSVKASDVDRWEKRAQISLFEAIAKAAAEAEGNINPAAAVAPLLKNTQVMGAFVYECGLTEKQRDKLEFDDFLKEIEWPDLLMQMDRVIESLFTFSPNLSEVEKDGGKKKSKKQSA